MTNLELEKLIHDNATPKKWRRFEKMLLWSLVSNPEVLIRKAESSRDEEPLDEEWEKLLPSVGKRCFLFELVHVKEVKKTFTLVIVNNDEVYLPEVYWESSQVPRYDYELACCLNDKNTLEEYMRRCDLSVER